MINLFDDSPARSAHEIFTEILVRENLRIERIVSTGQSTPTDNPIVRGMMNGCHSSRVWPAFDLKAKVKAIFVPAIMF